jgi:hypothetical protein
VLFLLPGRRYRGAAIATPRYDESTGSYWPELLPLLAALFLALLLSNAPQGAMHDWPQQPVSGA